MVPKFTSSEKKYNKQLAKSYITYMMVGSLFKKAVCKNLTEAKHLYLHYAEMPKEKQINQEYAVLKQLDNFDFFFLNQIKQMQCEVYMKPSNDCYLILFFTGFEKIVAKVDTKGHLELQAITD